jgi:hypothetical protein
MKMLPNLAIFVLASLTFSSVVSIDLTCQEALGELEKCVYAKLNAKRENTCFIRWNIRPYILPSIVPNHNNIK